MPEVKFSNTYNATTGNDFRLGLMQLFDQLQTIEGKISYLDFYNIQFAVETEEELGPTINKLTPGSALVINVTHRFFFNGKEYATGDVLLKLMDGSVIHIASQVGGVYFPKKIATKEGGYEISYEFYGASPEDGLVQVDTVANEEVATPKKTIVFTLPENVTDQQIYGITQHLTNNTFSFPCVYVPDTTTPIKPFIKFFYGWSDELYSGFSEEIYIEYKVDLQDGVWIITVDQNIDTSNTITAVVK